jgi:hypothetical protein
MSTEQKSDKELADQLDAEDRLRSRGYEKGECSRCKGMGFTVESGMYWLECGSCQGRGFVWRSPLTKEAIE